MPGCARPVRIFCSSFLKLSIDRAIFCSAVFLISAMVMVVPLNVYERALVFAGHHASQRSGLENAEHPYRQLLITAQREGSRIHDLQVAGDGLVEGNFVIARGARVLGGVGGVDTVDLGGLEDDLGP